MMPRMPWGRRDDRDARELNEEIASHFDEAVTERMARGESRDDAIAAARREFGNVAHAKELTRESWGGMWLDRAAQDVRYAVRALRRAPSFTIVAMLTLALGIGANTAMFTVVRGILLRPLPFPDPDRLFVVSHIPERARSFVGLAMTDGEYLDFRNFTRAFASTTTFNTFPASLVGAGEPTRVATAAVTPSFFATLGVRPVIGRPFNDGDATAAVAIVSAPLWRERFGGDSTAIGRSVRIEGYVKTIIGVMPDGFETPRQSQVWVPLSGTTADGSTRLQTVIGRLAPGATRTQAVAELHAFAQDEESRTPSNQRERTSTAIVSLRDATVGDIGHSLFVFSAAVALVLLIACANVSNLLLMRTATRRHELGIRAAIGARPSRLVRQLVTESGVVALAGGLVGLGVAWAGVRGLIALAPPGLLPRAHDIHVDPMVVAVMFATCMASGLVAGVVPAIAAARRNVRDALADAGRSTSRSPLRTLFLTTEAALALVLVIGAGLVAKSFVRLRSVDLGFSPDHVIAATLQFPVQQYPTAELLHDVTNRMLARMGRIPGVGSSAAVNWVPLSNSYVTGGFALEDGRELPPGYTVLKPCVSPDYLRVMGIGVREGRGLLASDNAQAPRVVLVSRGVARRLWPGTSAVGKRIAMADKPTPADWMTIVGVVDDIVQTGPSAPPQEAIYQAVAQVQQPFWLNEMTFVTYVASDPGPVAAAMRAAVLEIDPNQPVESITTMESRLSATIAEPRFRSVLLLVVSAVALALAAIGIYGVVAYAVTERTREMGIRIALGASRWSVVHLVLGGTARVTVPGLVLGLGVSWAATRVLSAFLFQVEPRDAVVFASGSAILLAVSLIAGYAPARRASRIDPIITMK